MKSFLRSRAIPNRTATSAKLTNFSPLLSQRSNNSTSGAAPGTTTSFASGLFNRKFLKGELIPFPRYESTGSDERDNYESLITAINEASTKASATSASSSSSSTTTATTPLSTWQDVGASGTAVAVEFGGLQLPHTSRAAIAETLGESGFLQAVHDLHHNVACSTLLTTFGSSELRGRLVTGLASGSARFVLAPFDLECMGDPAAVNATAVPAPPPREGDSTSSSSDSDSGATTYQLSGEAKVVSRFVTDTTTVTAASSSSSLPTHAIVLAKAETQTAATEAGGLPQVSQRCTLFVVELAESAAAATNNNSHKATYDAAKGLISLNNARTRDVVGAVGDGFAQLMIGSNTVRYTLDAALLGQGKSLLARLKEEAAADGTSSKNTALLTNMAAQLYGIESSLYAVTANLDRPTQDSLIEAALVTIQTRNVLTRFAAFAELSVASSSSSSSNTAALATATQQLSEMLQSLDSDTTLQWLASCCGVEDFALQFTAEKFFTTMSARTLRSIGVREKLPVSPPLAGSDEVTALEKQLMRFGDAVEATFVQLGGKLRYRQVVMERVARSAAYLYTGCAAVSRASSTSKANEHAATERALARKAAVLASEEASQLITEILEMARQPDDSYTRVVNELLMVHVPRAK